MFFTKEAIDEALAVQTNGYIFGSPDGVDKTHPNYIAVVDYLTGNSATLNSLQHDRINNYFSRLIVLVENDLTSPATQRLLNVLTDPIILNYAKKSDLLSRLINILFRVNTKDFLQQLLAVYARLGLSRFDLFEMLITRSRSQPEEYKEISFPGSSIRQFLEEIVRTSTSLPSLHTSSASQIIWNANYFRLLEEVRPEWLMDYMRRAAGAPRASEAVPFLVTHKEGKYLSDFLTILEERSITYNDHYSRLTLVFTLYPHNPEKYLPLVVRTAALFLDYLTTHQNPYEYKQDLGKITGGPSRLLPLSAMAFYFLLLDSPQQAQEKLQGWLDNGLLPAADVFAVFYESQGDAITLPYLKQALSKSLPEVIYLQNLLTVGSKFSNRSGYSEELWKLIDSKSKPVRELAARALATDPPAVSKAIQLLEHKKASTRLSAAIILSQQITAESTAAITIALNKETNDDSRDLLLEIIADTLPETMDKDQVRQMIGQAKDRGKLDKPVEAFLDETNLPQLTFKDGEILQPREVRFLLYRMSRNQPNRIDREALYLLPLLDKSGSGPFAETLLKLYTETNSAPEQKYLLTATALLGSEAQVDAIRLLVDKWVEAGRYKMAEYGISALALQGSNKAMRWVEWYSRKYSSKKANVGAAALTALEAAAEQQGITLHELGDRLVPDFGFDGLFKIFTAEGDEYRAFIDSKFKLTFFNEDNKKLKSLPAAATEEQKQEFKTVTKEVREIVKSQSSRLEYYLITQRKWTFAQWQSFFLNNPVMFIYATKLLWGVYNSDAELPPVKTFLCEEDTTLLDQDDVEFSPEADSYIGIVHPVHLETSLLKHWQEKFFDREITSIFPQLDRKQANLSDIDLNNTILLKFQGRHTKTGSIRSTLDNKGWQKGPTGDGGFLESYKLIHRAKKIEAVLELEGVGVGFGWGAEEKLGRLYIVDKNKVRQRWFYPKDEKDESLVLLKDVPAIFLHEMLAAIDSISLNNP